MRSRQQCLVIRHKEAWHHWMLRLNVWLAVQLSDFGRPIELKLQVLQAVWLCKANGDSVSGRPSDRRFSDRQDFNDVERVDTEMLLASSGKDLCWQHRGKLSSQSLLRSDECGGERCARNVRLSRRTVSRFLGKACRRSRDHCEYESPGGRLSSRRVHEIASLPSMLCDTEKAQGERCQLAESCLSHIGGAA